MGKWYLTVARKCVKSLLVHKLRSFLSTLGILIGTMSVIAMLAIGEGAKQETIEQIKQLGTNVIVLRSLSEEGFNEEDPNILNKSIPSLALISPIKAVKAVLKASQSHLSPEILAVTPAYFNMKKWELLEGRFLCALDISEKKHNCVIGSALARKLGKEGHVGGSLWLEKTHYHIAGILKPIEGKSSSNKQSVDDMLFIPYSFGNQLKEIVIQLKNQSFVKPAAILTQKVLERIYQTKEGYQIIVPLELLRQAHQVQITFNWVLGGIAGLSLLIGGIGITNVMLASINERTREIGLCRALGATKMHILIEFLLETALLTSMGGLLGTLLGICVSFAISLLARWPVSITFWSVFLSLAMSAIAGLLAGVYPAHRAANMHPIVALRFN